MIPLTESSTTGEAIWLTICFLILLLIVGAYGYKLNKILVKKNERKKLV